MARSWFKTGTAYDVIWSPLGRRKLNLLNDCAEEVIDMNCTKLKNTVKGSGWSLCRSVNEDKEIFLIRRRWTLVYATSPRFLYEILMMVSVRVWEKVEENE